MIFDLAQQELANLICFTLLHHEEEEIDGFFNPFNTKVVVHSIECDHKTRPFNGIPGFPISWGHSTPYTLCSVFMLSCVDIIVGVTVICIHFSTPHGVHLPSQCVKVSTKK